MLPSFNQLQQLSSESLEVFCFKLRENICYVLFYLFGLHFIYSRLNLGIVQIIACVRVDPALTGHRLIGHERLHPPQIPALQTCLPKRFPLRVPCLVVVSRYLLLSKTLIREAPRESAWLRIERRRRHDDCAILVLARCPAINIWIRNYSHLTMLRSLLLLEEPLLLSKVHRRSDRTQDVT